MTSESSLYAVPDLIPLVPGWMGHYPEFCAYYSLFSLEVYCMRIVLRGFELHINSVKLCIAICFFPSQHYVWATPSCWCLWLRSVYFHCRVVFRCTN